jgi:serpin B
MIDLKFFLLLIILTNNPLPAEEPAPRELLKRGAVEFSIKALKEVHKEKSGENLLLSPISLQMALSIALNGAEGETKDSIKAVLGYQDLPIDTINKFYFNLQKSLKNPGKKIELRIASALWGDEKIYFSEEFLREVRNYYEAKLKTLKFPDELEMINNWVKEASKGKIDRIIDQVDPNTILILTNAIYFYGEWEYKFNKKKTKKRPFYLISGDTIEVLTMKVKAHFPYYEDSIVQAVELPYGKEGRFSMVIVLPRDYSGLPALIENLTLEKWNLWLKNMVESQGTVMLPRFSFECTLDLDSTLSKLGMGIAFDENRADFGKIAETAYSIYISKVLQKTYIKVNEKGTEAAASTGLFFGITALPQKIKMVIDHPFLFTIKDKETDTILFVGTVYIPKE